MVSPRLHTQGRTEFIRCAERTLTRGGVRSCQEQEDKPEEQSAEYDVLLAVPLAGADVGDAESHARSAAPVAEAPANNDAVRAEWPAVPGAPDGALAEPSEELLAERQCLYQTRWRPDEPSSGGSNVTWRAARSGLPAGDCETGSSFRIDSLGVSTTNLGFTAKRISN